MISKLAIVVLVMGVVCLAIGGIFIGQSIIKNNLLVTAMRQENITLGIPSDKIAENEVIDSAAEAEVAGDTIREHRHSIAPTYGDLLGGEQYNPADLTQLTYAQALNLENYLYLAVLGFGVTQVVLGTGVFMAVTGIALLLVGIALLRLAGRKT
jgi:hypothetical protein